MKFIVDQLILALFNYLNSQIDAYKILQNKTIAHGVNFGAYAALTAALVYLSHDTFWASFTFCLSAFFNRNLVFDSFLNKKRGLSIYYVSTAEVPSSFLDRIEIRIFGRNGKVIFFFYAIGWGVTIILNFLI